MAYVYILLCADGTFYTGTARDLLHRMRDHFEKRPAAAAYTRAKGAKRLLVAWECESFSAALRAEVAIKRLKRAEKEALIAHPATLSPEGFPSLGGLLYRPLTEDDAPLLEVRQSFG